MSKLKGNDLMALGYEPGISMGIALRIASNSKHKPIDELLAELKDVLTRPIDYVNHDVYGKLADSLIPKVDETKKELNPEGVPFRIYGEDMIEDEAMRQMSVASRLPVSVRGAIMPDGHAGYGLPIGGVLATENAIIPYGVGVDIGCRMALSIYEAPPNYIDRHMNNLRQALLDHTRFGRDEVHASPSDSAIFSRSEFDDIKFLNGWKDRAWKQLGTSGSGNHFCSFGEVEIGSEGLNDIPAGKYVGIITHSGSRGMGANVAKYYTNLAMKSCVLPPEAKFLAWLDMSTQEGQEYWLAMNLCGDYASACHHDIHKRLAKSIGMKPLTVVENHHNFAWKEIHDGRELIVHRKGATPAGEGTLGIIPGSMASHAFIVKGKGDSSSLHSASHGAGRRMSRTQARESFSKHELRDILKDHNITLIGAGMDEAPMAYKDIREVMKKQTDLVSVVGTFFPRVVRMDDGDDD